MFSREQTAYLIKLYEQYPILYETSNKCYKSKTRWNMALEAITIEFNKMFTIEISIDEIRKKNNFRAQFFGEMNKIKKSMVSGVF